MKYTWLVVIWIFLILIGMIFHDYLFFLIVTGFIISVIVAIIAVSERKNIFSKNSETVFELNHELPQSNYFSLTQKFMNARGDDEKIIELEKCLPFLESFVSFSFENDKELPPYVPCRDTLPELYMRKGEWEKAEAIIRLCISISAYGYTEYINSQDHYGHWISENGESELLNLQKRGETSVNVLQYLSENPGAFQKDIYKVLELSSCDHDALVWFCRNSRQIRKEKSENTNKLFIMEQ